MQGRDALKIEWDHGENASYDTEEFAKQLKETVNRPGTAAAFFGRCRNSDCRREKRDQSRLLRPASGSCLDGNDLRGG